MAFKAFILSVSILTIYPIPEASAASKNLCDDMIASGKSTTIQVQKCIEKFGESKFYKENYKKKKWQQEEEIAKSAEEAARRANVETKKFTSAELDEAGFGKPFFAIRVDYSNPRSPKEKRITEGDSLCNYLGYEKVLKSIVSAEIMPSEANNNGFVIDKNFLGSVKKEPEMYVDKNEKYTVRKYEEITCAKVTSKDVKGTSAELGKVAEDLIVLNVMINSPRSESSKSVDDGPRRPATDSKTPMGYTKPDWATEPQNTTSK